MSALRGRDCALLPHATEPRALLVPGAAGWVLPEFIPDREIHHVDPVHAGEAMRAQLGEFTTRYPVRVPEPAIPAPLNVCVVEPVAAKLTPPSLIPREAELLPILATMAEAYLPAVVTVDPEGDWLLTRDTGGCALSLPLRCGTAPVRPLQPDPGGTEASRPTR